MGFVELDRSEALAYLVQVGKVSDAGEDVLVWIFAEAFCVIKVATDGFDDEREKREEGKNEQCCVPRKQMCRHWCNCEVVLDQMKKKVILLQLNVQSIVMATIDMNLYAAHGH